MSSQQYTGLLTPQQQLSFYKIVWAQFCNQIDWHEIELKMSKLACLKGLHNDINSPEW